jgi:phage-related protein
MLEVDFYKSSNGKCPVVKYIDSLNAKQSKKVAWVLNVVESLNQVPIDYLKKLKSTDDIWEVRIQLASNIFRLLGFIEDKRLILTNGFTKKTQKTPRREIDKAERRKANYITRKKNKNE